MAEQTQHEKVTLDDTASTNSLDDPTPSRALMEKAFPSLCTIMYWTGKNEAATKGIKGLDLQCLESFNPSGLKRHRTCDAWDSLDGLQEVLATARSLEHTKDNDLRVWFSSVLSSDTAARPDLEALLANPDLAVTSESFYVEGLIRKTYIQLLLLKQSILGVQHAGLLTRVSKMLNKLEGHARFSVVSHRDAALSQELLRCSGSYWERVSWDEWIDGAECELLTTKEVMDDCSVQSFLEIFLDWYPAVVKQIDLGLPILRSLFGKSHRNVQHVRFSSAMDLSPTLDSTSAGSFDGATGFTKELPASQDHIETIITSILRADEIVSKEKLAQTLPLDDYEALDNEGTVLSVCPWELSRENLWRTHDQYYREAFLRGENKAERRSDLTAWYVENYHPSIDSFPELEPFILRELGARGEKDGFVSDSPTTSSGSTSASPTLLVPRRTPSVISRSWWMCKRPSSQ